MIGDKHVRGQSKDAAKSAAKERPNKSRESRARTRAAISRHSERLHAGCPI